MKISTKKLICLCSILASLLLLTDALASKPSPTGYWRTIDDKTQQPKSIIKLYESEGSLSADIVKLLPPYDEPEHAFCRKCPGDLRNHPVIGLTIFWDMKKAKDKWEGGKIMDPENGAIYKSSFSLSDDNKRLRVRGYLGLPLLGRTQVWERVSSKDSV